MSETNGERLIDRIVARAPSARRMIRVPEWDVDLYFPPVTSAQLEAALPKNGDKSTAPPSLFLLVHLAQDEAGNRLFRKADIEMLRQRADLNVLTRVQDFMWNTVTPSDEAAETDLKNTPSLSGASPSPES